MLNNESWVYEVFCLVFFWDLSPIETKKNHAIYFSNDFFGLIIVAEVFNP